MGLAPSARLRRSVSRCAGTGPHIVSFGKNVRVDKIYMKGLDTFQGKTVGVVLRREQCLQLASDLLLGALSNEEELKAIDLTLYLERSAITVTAGKGRWHGLEDMQQPSLCVFHKHILL